MGYLTGKRVLVTGATSSGGVGEGVLQAVAEAGGTLLINGRDPEKTRATAAKYPGSVALPGDVTIPEDIARMFAAAREKVGTVHCLVNNAGIGLCRKPHLAHEDEFDRLHNTDVRAVWLMSRAFIIQLLDASKGLDPIPGAIVNISSVHAHSTIPGYGIYAGAKAGIDGFTRGLAVEYVPQNIRCNVVAPGYVHAEQNMEMLRNWTEDPEAWVDTHTREEQALPRLIEPIDCGRVVAFLLSDASKCVTGQVLRADAGLTTMLYSRSFVS